MKSFLRSRSIIKHLLWLSLPCAALLLYTYVFATSNSQFRMWPMLDGESKRDLQVIYSTLNFSRDDSSGMVIGAITDPSRRERLLSSQPFSHCSNNCTTWLSGQQIDHYDMALIDPNSFNPLKLSPGSAVAPHVLRAITNSDELRCVTRYSSQKRPLPVDQKQTQEVGRDVFCTSSDIGFFVYAFSEP